MTSSECFVGFSRAASDSPVPFSSLLHDLSAKNACALLSRPHLFLSSLHENHENHGTSLTLNSIRMDPLPKHGLSTKKFFHLHKLYIDIILCKINSSRIMKMFFFCMQVLNYTLSLDRCYLEQNGLNLLVTLVTPVNCQF